MSSYLMIPGAGGAAWYWHRVVPLLEAAGHEAIAVDLPGPDPEAGLPEYTELALAAADGRDDVVLAAISMGAFTAPLVAARRPLKALVLVNAMIPVPGETAGQWWDDTSSQEARVQAAQEGDYSTEFDLDTYFLHDVPPEALEVARARAKRPRPRSLRPATSPPGRTSRSTWSAATTGSSRPSSSAGWPRTGWGSKPTCCPVVT